MITYEQACKIEMGSTLWLIYVTYPCVNEYELRSREVAYGECELRCRSWFGEKQTFIIPRTEPSEVLYRHKPVNIIANIHTGYTRPLEEATRFKWFRLEGYLHE